MSSRLCEARGSDTLHTRPKCQSFQVLFIVSSKNKRFRFAQTVKQYSTRRFLMHARWYTFFCAFGAGGGGGSLKFAVHWLC